MPGHVQMGATGALDVDVGHFYPHLGQKREALGVRQDAERMMAENWNTLHINVKSREENAA